MQRFVLPRQPVYFYRSMNCNATRLPYRQTLAFSKMALDYIDRAPALEPFYSYPVTLQGIQKAMEARQHVTINRALLVKELEQQYKGVDTPDAVRNNIAALQADDTFTVTTAHQNNLFTGPLYFVYKILHAIRLADHLQQSFPGKRFVPVYYMGSEDADLDELNHIQLGEDRLTWATNQTGAVGRMKIDKAVGLLIDRMEGQLVVLPEGAAFIALLRKYYREGVTVQEATFQLVNALFGSYGLVVLLPDNAQLKKQMIPVFEEELLHQTASGLVEETAARLEAAGYKVQAHPRAINLFYLKDDIRERIEKKGDHYVVVNTAIRFTEAALLEELKAHPERFSPNVILRGLFQETILPNVAFIGGGGETAYWLQLKSLFEKFKVPFPVLVLRNSFLVVEKKWQEKIQKLGITIEDLFQSGEALLTKLVREEKPDQTRLNGSLTRLEELYQVFRKQAGAVDTTLEKHVDALRTQTVYRLQELEKKMLRAAKRKFADQHRQIQTLRAHLFPENGLQERYENLGTFYAKWGPAFLQKIYEYSPALEQEFVIIREQ